MRIGRALGLGLAVASLMVGTACSNDSPEGDSDNTPTESAGGASSAGGGGGGEDKGTVVISGQNFGEMQIMAAMYQQVLENAGYTVPAPKLVTTRDVYVPGLKSGDIDVVPDYLAGMADFLNTDANGADAPVISTNSPEATLKKLKPLADDAGITMLEPAEATDQNAFAVTTDFAEENNLTTLSDLAALNQPIVLAAPPDCKGRPDCEGGLTSVYGLDITKIIPLDYDSAAAKDSVTSGESDLGEVATTDAALEQEGLVALEDDKGIQPAQNLIPAVNSDFLNENPDVATVLNKLSATLTTDDLAQMDLEVAVNRQQPEDVAQEYLESKGLL
jgi:osmoprotectant transport system substrate-binding protein